MNTSTQTRSYPKGSTVITPKGLPTVKVALYTNQRGAPCAMAFTSNRQKRASFVYRFQNDEQRHKLVSKFIDAEIAKSIVKTQRASKRVLDVNPLSIGDILCTSWGYDQTNVEFYQVTAVKGKSVAISEVESERVSGDSFSGSVIAKRDSFRANGYTATKRVMTFNAGETVYINAEYSTARLWDGTPQCSTSYA